MYISIGNKSFFEEQSFAKLNYGIEQQEKVIENIFCEI